MTGVRQTFHTRPPTAHFLGWCAGADAFRRRPVNQNPFEPGTLEWRTWESAFESGYHDERDRVSD